MIGIRSMTIRQRFEAKVERLADDQCWPWKGKTSDAGGAGYGRLRVGPRAAGDELAHRLAWEFWVGPIPEGLTIDHKCLNRRCCNPKHLQVVTREENSRLAKRRWEHCPRGHEFTDENTYWRPEGRRMCRRCIAIRKGRAHA